MTIMALKRVVVIKGVSIHISTSPSLYTGDVGGMLQMVSEPLPSLRWGERAQAHEDR